MLPRLALTLALAALIGPRAFAQQPESDAVAPAHVSHVEGVATLEREGRAESSALNVPLLSGDRLKTADGRIEVLFADGSALHLDNRTTLDIQSDDLVRLIDGRLRLNIAGPARAVAYRIDSPAGSLRISQAGEYRIALLRGQEETQLELAVLRGSGEIFTEHGTTAVRAGERAYASAGLAPSYAYSYNSANWDAFDRWSESRRNTRLGVSTQYLPSEVRPYSSTFDEYGDWRYEQTYGYVWYPRVDVAWRPYYHGRWASYPRYGWTWIGSDRWAWPTHHYGRWGFRSGLWFWIPASRWAPAYVSWAYAPGYVSWCPLGWDNRPVISVNIFNVGPGYYSSSRAWTVIGYSHFGRDYVHRRAVDWDRWDRSRRPTFQLARSAPTGRDIAVPRNATPIRWAGSRDLPLDRVRQGSGGQDGGTYSAGDRTPRWLPPSGGRSTETAVPRYTNRGDEVIRSQTERPSSPTRGFENRRVPSVRENPSIRDNTAVSRTAPRPDGARGGLSDSRRAEGPAQRTDRQPLERPQDVNVPQADVNRGTEYRRPGYSAPERALPRGNAGAPPDHPAYQPRAYQPPPRSYDAPSRPYDPAARPYERSRVAPPREMQPAPIQRAPEARPQEYSRPPEQARPRGGFDARPPASPPPASPPPPRAAGPPDQRSAPRDRQAPPPQAAPSGGSGSQQAVPRARGGRGGA